MKPNNPPQKSGGAVPPRRKRRSRMISLRLTVADRVAFEAAAVKSRRNLSDWLVGVGQAAAKLAKRRLPGGDDGR